MIPREKLTELPVLHKEVWKGDLVMVKLVTKNAKKRGSDVNYQDEEQRCVSICLYVCVCVH